MGSGRRLPSGPAGTRRFPALRRSVRRRFRAVRWKRGVPCIAIIDDKEQPPIVRASALTRLEPWLTPARSPTVTSSLNDADPIVRLAAVEALLDARPSK